jgi:hypothetical protein
MSRHLTETLYVTAIEAGYTSVTYARLCYGILERLSSRLRACQKNCEKNAQWISSAQSRAVCILVFRMKPETRSFYEQAVRRDRVHRV